MLQYPAFPDIQKLLYCICMWNMKPDEMMHMKVFKKRTKEL